MRSSKWMAVAVVGVVILAGIAVAGSMPGVADVQRISFTSPIRVGATLLPKGEYEIRYVMEGENHIMVFHARDQKNVPDVRIKCTLVALAQKATETEKIYTTNAAKEEVLQELVFRGDKAKHVF